MTAADVDAYIARFPDDVAERLRSIRGVVLAAVPEPEEKVRYGIAAVMLDGRYALHYAGWKKHIGLYPVPTLPDALEAEVGPYRSETDSVVFPHAEPLPIDLIARVATAVAALRTAG